MTFQYQVLANQLAHRIYQDELKPHQKLISLRDFARQHGISLSTAKVAMNYLRRGTHLCKAEVRLFCGCSHPI